MYYIVATYVTTKGHSNERCFYLYRGISGLKNELFFNQ